MGIRDLLNAFLAGVVFLYSTTSAFADFSQSEIKELVTPIALYPDPLLQAVFPASTFPDQIADAALLVRNKTDAELIKDQTWDDSVKVIATYPGVLKMMYEKLDWTTELGKAFLAQHEQVLAEIQQLRAQAKSVGNLKSTSGQEVSQSTQHGQTVIVIEPTDPQVIYVPQQTTHVVYTEPVSDPSDMWVPVATFGLGLALGSAMSDDDDDHYYYSGPWGRGIWSDDAYDHWVDQRHDTINHAIDVRDDRITDRQDFRQDQKKDRQDFRQDWAKDHPDQVNRDNLKANSDQIRQNYEAKKGQRQQQVNDRRASYASQRQTSAAPRRDAYASSGWSGQGGRAYASRSSMRGSSSLGSAGRASGGYRGGRGGGGGRGRR